MAADFSVIFEHTLNEACSVYSFSGSCPKTVSRITEVFSHRFYNAVTADCAHQSRRVVFFFLFFYFGEKGACPK